MERLSSPVTCHMEKWWCGGTPGLPARQQGLLTSHSLLYFFLMTPPVSILSVKIGLSPRLKPTALRCTVTRTVTRTDLGHRGRH